MPGSYEVGAVFSVRTNMPVSSRLRKSSLTHRSKLMVRKLALAFMMASTRLLLLLTIDATAAAATWGDGMDAGVARLTAKYGKEVQLLEGLLARSG